MIHKSGIENAKMLNCMLLFLYNPILFYWVFLGRQMSSGSKTDQIEKKNRPLNQEISVIYVQKHERRFLLK